MNIGVLGAGSWGTTLAIVLDSNGHRVTLWSLFEEEIEAIKLSRVNETYLPGITLPASIALSHMIEDAVIGKDMIVIATPSQFVREVLRRFHTLQIDEPVFVNVAKGIERGSLLRMSEIVRELFPQLPLENYAVLSGPSHAEEVSRQKATSVVVASSSVETALLVQQAFMTDSLRVYSSTDVIGVELGGALKNVIAIGAGICDGGGYGDNTKAALITRGIAEIRRLGIALGAKPETFSGLSGLGDLIVTTMSRHSRNRYVGEELGKGRTLPDILSQMKMVAEGVETTRSAHDLALKTDVEMPIVHQMYHILFENQDSATALRTLMTRAAKDETWS